MWFTDEDDYGRLHRTQNESVADKFLSMTSNLVSMMVPDMPEKSVDSINPNGRSKRKNSKISMIEEDKGSKLPDPLKLYKASSLFSVILDILADDFAIHDDLSNTILNCVCYCAFTNSNPKFLSSWIDLSVNMLLHTQLWVDLKLKCIVEDLAQRLLHQLTLAWFRNGNNVLEFASEVHARLNYIDLDNAYWVISNIKSPVLKVSLADCFLPRLSFIEDSLTGLKDSEPSPLKLRTFHLIIQPHVDDRGKDNAIRWQMYVLLIHIMLAGLLEFHSISRAEMVEIGNIVQKLDQKCDKKRLGKKVKEEISLLLSTIELELII
ncbi:hypothetical protein HK096_000227 [Nowakowskiella sp. JEL0078]|nr:hypothetical protein HK096_000227 [Nowakowskiella sp. JEL0078]